MHAEIQTLISLWWADTSKYRPAGLGLVQRQHCEEFSVFKTVLCLVGVSVQIWVVATECRSFFSFQKDTAFVLLAVQDIEAVGNCLDLVSI